MTLRGIISVLAGLIGMASLWWLIDAIGDRREAKVHARYVAAAKATNLDLSAFNSEDERVAAVAQALRDKAVADAGNLKETGCPATKAQAEALSRIP